MKKHLVAENKQIFTDSQIHNRNFRNNMQLFLGNFVHDVICVAMCWIAKDEFKWKISVIDMSVTHDTATHHYTQALNYNERRQKIF